MSGRMGRELTLRRSLQAKALSILDRRPDLGEDHLELTRVGRLDALAAIE